MSGAALANCGNLGRARRTKSLREATQLAKPSLQVLTETAPALLPLEELARRINRSHEQCLAQPATGLMHARNAGEWLLQASEQLSPPQWLSWLAAHCTVSERTAQTYMQIAMGWPRLKPSAGVPPIGAIPSGIAALHAAKPPDTDSVPAKAVDLPPAPAAVAETLPPLPADSEKNAAIPSGITSSTVAAPKELQARPQLTFFIPGEVVPKARPRVTANGTFMPRRYREWRNRAEVEISRQIFELKMNAALPVQLPLKQAAVKIRLVGQHRLNADADNIVGSCLDAMVAVGIIKNDCLSYIPEISFKFVPEGTKGVHIKAIALRSEEDDFPI